jgi:RHS repeat-associated protein
VPDRKHKIRPFGRIYQVAGPGFEYHPLNGDQGPPRISVGFNDGSGLKFLLTDHLGSVVAVTDSTGTLLSEQRYLPFGEVRTVGGTNQTDFGYTGQRNLDAQGNAFSLGLMDYNARFYDPILGRFIQPDTVVPGAGSSAAYNRYAYVMNNPINLTDLFGHEGCRRNLGPGVHSEYDCPEDAWSYDGNATTGEISGQAAIRNDAIEKQASDARKAFMAAERNSYSSEQEIVNISPSNNQDTPYSIEMNEHPKTTQFDAPGIDIGLDFGSGVRTTGNQNFILEINRSGTLKVSIVPEILGKETPLYYSFDFKEGAFSHGLQGNFDFAEYNLGYSYRLSRGFSSTTGFEFSSKGFTNKQHTGIYSFYEGHVRLSPLLTIGLPMAFAAGPEVGVIFGGIYSYQLVRAFILGQ